MLASSSRNIEVSAEEKQRLDALEKEFLDGDVTVKGYYKKKCEVLIPYLPDADVIHSELRSIHCMDVPDTLKKKVEKLFEELRIVVKGNEDMQDNLYHNGDVSSEIKTERTSCSPIKMKQELIDADSTEAAAQSELNRTTSAKIGSVSLIDVNEILARPEKVNGFVEVPKARGRRSKANTLAETMELPAPNGPANEESPAGDSMRRSRRSITRFAPVKQEPTPAGSCGEKNGLPGSGAQQQTITTMFAKQQKKEISGFQSNEDDAEDEHIHKKKKRVERSKRECKESVQPQGPKARKIPDRCHVCRQILDSPDLRIYQGHPPNALEEIIALTDSRMSLFTGKEDEINEHDMRPQQKLTYFSIYDKEGHLCPIDSGLLERNVLLYISGYMKAIFEENPEPEGGIPVKDLGPINEWFVSGFDGGEKALLGLQTGYAEYFLMEPSEDYAPFMDSIREKVYMNKVVIEYLLEEPRASYEDLLNKLHTTVPPKGISSLSEDLLLRHAQFICDQVYNFDLAAGDEDDQLIIAPCMENLVDLCSVSLGKRRAVSRQSRKDMKIEKKPTWSKATTTPLVKNVFEEFFRDQIDGHEDVEIEIKGPKRKRCGKCDNCQQPDCGSCTACRGMVKFGGSGKSKQACDKRECSNFTIGDGAEVSDNEEDGKKRLHEDDKGFPWQPTPENIKLQKEDHEIKWVGSLVIDEGGRKYYRKALVGGEEIENNNWIIVQSSSSDDSSKLFFCQVMYMYENKQHKKIFHANWFCRGDQTVLGDTADPRELFLIENCEDVLLRTVMTKADVIYKPTPDDWFSCGGESIGNAKLAEADGKTFFYQKRYDGDFARFEDVLDHPCKLPELAHKYCPTCEQGYLQMRRDCACVSDKLETKGSKGETLFGLLKYNGAEYRVGSAIFVYPEVYGFRITPADPPDSPKEKQDDEIDEDVYPEFYRKKSDNVKGSNMETPEPFRVALITSIYTHGSRAASGRMTSPDKVWIKVQKLYRPENTHRGILASRHADWNMLYWSDEECCLPISRIAGKCYVVYSENLDMTVSEWSHGGPNRFYFTQAYNSSTQTFEEPPEKGRNVGKQSRGKGKGKGKGKKSLSLNDVEKERIEEWPQISHRLKCLDVFAGCGGLSEGLRQSELIDIKWAIERDDAPAHAFRLNNPQTIVFTEDCNLLLKLVMSGEKVTERGQKLPQKGEVDLICGGPPCQGFSGMNRFRTLKYSLFKNSLVVSFLSYCDYYRPRFFILENVRNFVSFKQNMVLKLTLRCLLRMGYQCTFGILQAGNYGVPQTRRRLIILAAAPGEKLPQYPEPTHVFSPRACQLSVVIDDTKFTTNCNWIKSAPFRTITVRDALSDLPPIKNGWKKDEADYADEPQTHFQRLMRGNQYNPLLRDHSCKEMPPIVEARVSYIPKAAGSDWRDLPNLAVRLSDGTYTKKLQYLYHDKKNGKSSTGAFRGVCSCATGSSCDPMDKQFGTLIPWCLPHTGNRHNNWAGLYGRLGWDGFFGTTITNPEPMGKQGRVLHPEQCRLVSVRECARSQGFPDTYRFYGNVVEKHRQVGNAVPPPMGAAIGYEIRKCVSEKDNQRCTVKVEVEV